jgi:hypothetical protein
MPIDKKKAADGGVTPPRLVRISDADWDKFTRACERLKLPIGETAGDVLAWWAGLSHEGRQLFAGVLAPERHAAAVESVKREILKRAKAEG